MHEISGSQILIHLKNKWKYKVLLTHFIIALALTIIVMVLLYKLNLVSLFWGLPCLLVLFIAITAINRRWQISELDVSRFLNVTNPSLEESSQLVLKPPLSLNFLEKLQLRKVELLLQTLKAPDPFKRQVFASLIVLLIASVVSLILFKTTFDSQPFINSKTTSSINYIPEKLLPEIKNLSVTIVPPSYTGKGSRRQSRLNLLAAEGAAVSWNIQTNIPAKEVQFTFNDGKTLLLESDEKRMNWKAEKLITAPGFYQVKIDNKLSELYRIEAIKDQPPAITILLPKPATTIVYGQPERVVVKASLDDDYGISAANIFATISSGQGEAVKFKQQKFSFESFAAGSKEYRLQKLIDLKTMGLQPGDELYFFISAVDNHKQETHSDVYIVTLQDTADQTILSGLVRGLDIKPELFRSERQIIIETEQLLKDKAKISTEEFKRKSNDLGIDQKLLRLRYGKFLGEETDTEIGNDHHDEGKHNNIGTSNADILEQYGHKHDNAEDASFFDAATKKQLKETLNEMWNAELKLRTFLPKGALPYEYRALRLLKDLQQKSRAYVPKTGFKSTPLNLEKRLTGDLTKIAQPITTESFKKQDATTSGRALGILEQLKNDGQLTTSSKEILQQAFQQLSIKAANQPSVYLSSLSALRKILNENFKVKDIGVAEHGLQKIMTTVTEKFPYTNGNAANNLSKQYFINLNKSSRQ